ncbi:MAG: hypothetical protein M1828_003748 [Chrysothrix sp. TS-e1954]|nr:MAG: hypothetical protein M1828_003748 [Chrysothrix sp. TS-e1954]
MASPNANDPSTLPGHNPNLTTSSPSDPTNDAPNLPRDPNQPLHRKPRVFIHRPSEDPAEETEAYKNTSYFTALKTMPWAEKVTNIHKIPCFRDAAMPAIPTGLGVGALRFLVGASLNTSITWAGVGFIATYEGLWEYCRWQRRKEKDGIRRAVAVLDQKQREKDEEAKLKVERQAEEAKVMQGTGFWQSFKFW